MGASAGVQFFETTSTRYFVSPDVLFERGRFGVHAALDWGSGRAFTATHLDGTWRIRSGRNYTVLFGAGATFLDLGGAQSQTTWNAELEVARHVQRYELVARARYYDYTIHEFRGQSTSPTGPAVSVGVRWRVRG